MRIGGFSRRLIPAICLLSLVAVAGCGPTTTVVLLPDPVKTGGAVSLSTEKGQAVLDQPYQSAQVRAGEAPAKPVATEPAKVAVEFAKALAAEPPRPLNFILYFKLDSTNLTDESQKLLPKVFQAITDRQSFFVSVVGHTDTLGQAEWNRKLSLKRARAVAKLLLDKGVPESSLKITSHGEANLLAPTPDETPEPKNRRVEITVR